MVHLSFCAKYVKRELHKITIKIDACIGGFDLRLRAFASLKATDHFSILIMDRWSTND
jgi:hypothetical protein